jgi:hypothetical protein
MKSYDCASRALASYLGKKRCFPGEVNTDKYNIEVDEDYTYYPYWIGSVWTLKERALPIYPPKQITYYVVTDGMEGSFIVLRNVPKTKVTECCDDEVLPARITEKRLMKEILDEAIAERINKQFIFGSPQSRKQASEMIYLPMIKVRIKKREHAKSEFKHYYVNIYTGEVKAV